MKYLTRILIISITTAFLISLSGCKKFLDINVDPNNPSDSPVNLLLPSGQQALAGYLGMGGTGISFAPTIYMHQYVRRGVDLNDYGITGSNFENEVPWEGLYSAALSDIDIVITQGKENGNLIYVGIAQVLKAYAYSQLVDVWGDVPFSEALLGPENANPKFDNGADIYPALFAMIDEGIANIQTGNGLKPGTDDLFYGGDTGKWVRFANTLKLKMYNQVRLVQNVGSDVGSLISANNMIREGDDFEFAYGTSVSPDNRNPGFVEEYGGNGQYISPYFYEILNGKSSDNPIMNGVVDPRIPYYYYNQLSPGAAAQNPTAYQDGEFVSIWMFSFNIDPNEGFDQSQSQTLAGLYPVGGRYDDGNGGVGTTTNALGITPQRFLPYFNHLFIRAELAASGVTSENAKDLLEAGIRAAFAKVNQVATLGGAPLMKDTDVDIYTDEVLARYDAANAAGKMEMIMTQKWIASFGFGVDMYTDYRRTGYPKLFDGNTDSNPFTVRGREFPVSFPYPSDAINLNSNSPSQRTIALDKVFWDN